MSESMQVAIVGLIGTVIGILVTKGVDALIRYRRAEGAMEMTSANNLYKRILHLEGEISRLQAEVSSLQYKLGKSDAEIEILRARADKMVAANTASAIVTKAANTAANVVATAAGVVAVAEAEKLK